MTLVQTELKKIYTWVRTNSYTRYTPTSTTMLYLPLETTHNEEDQSGHSISVTNNGVEFNTYAGVDCAYFDGNDKLVLGSIGSGTSFTRSFWFCFTPSGDYGTYTGIFGSNSSTQRYYPISGNNTTYRINYQYRNNNGNSSRSTPLLSTGRHMYTITKTGTSVKSYIDGALEYTATNGLSSGSLSGGYCIGQNLYSGYYGYKGYLSEFIIDNKARTDAEVATQYNNMVGYYNVQKEIKRVTMRPNGTEKQIRPIIPPYLCFTANTAGSTVKLTKYGSPTGLTLETSTDGSNWSAYTIDSVITLSNIGDKVYWRNTSETTVTFNPSANNRYYFGMTGSIAASGDITSLVNKNCTTTLIGDYCFSNMFSGCSSLTTAPSLPATTLTYCCYLATFLNCTSLTIAPSLPATTLAENCYSQMFQGCTSLTIAPSLPSTTLANRCYSNMFYNCTNLDTLPNLPAITLTDSCYQGMFAGCSKIKLSTTQTGIYQTQYRIPTTGTGTVGSSSLSRMFDSTGGTFTSNPSINTTYYTSNTLV